MLALGEQHGAKIWNMLDDDELRQISIVMSTIGTIEAELVENLLLEFVSRMSASGALMGNFDAHRAAAAAISAARAGQQHHGGNPRARRPQHVGKALQRAGRGARQLPQERIPADRRRGAVQDRARSTPRACLPILPEDLALDVVNRMLRMEAVQKEVLERVEQTLRTEFMSNLSQTRRRDAHEVMAEIFNNFDRQTETRFLTALEEDNRESAERIKTLMFTFDDLTKLDAGSAQTLMRHVEKDKLAVALKGAAEPVRQFFLSNMSTRAAKMLLDDMGAMGPVRLREVDDAQALLVNLAKDLAAKGEIVISKSRGEEELVY